VLATGSGNAGTCEKFHDRSRIQFRQKAGVCASGLGLFILLPGKAPLVLSTTTTHPHPFKLWPYCWLAVHRCSDVYRVVNQRFVLYKCGNKPAVLSTWQACVGGRFQCVVTLDVPHKLHYLWTNSQGGGVSSYLTSINRNFTNWRESISYSRHSCVNRQQAACSKLFSPEQNAQPENCSLLTLLAVKSWATHAYLRDLTRYVVHPLMIFAEPFFSFALKCAYAIRKAWKQSHGRKRLLFTGGDENDLRRSDVTRLFLAHGASNHNGCP
jgi:hypothetical protein